MTRLEDWEVRLGASIEEAKARDFDWGTFDCALAAADPENPPTWMHRLKTLRELLEALGADSV